jgi:hypothetical protein
VDFYSKGRGIGYRELWDGWCFSQEVVVYIHRFARLTDPKESIGKKLTQIYDGPFEIIDRLSPVTYRLRLPSSYAIHNVLNVSHLELYHESGTEWGQRVSRPPKRIATAANEVEVEKIVAEKFKKVGTRKIPYYKVRYLN